MNAFWGTHKEEAVGHTGLGWKRHGNFYACCVYGRSLHFQQAWRLMSGGWEQTMIVIMKERKSTASFKESFIPNSLPSMSPENSFTAPSDQILMKKRKKGGGNGRILLSQTIDLRPSQIFTQLEKNNWLYAIYFRKCPGYMSLLWAGTCLPWNILFQDVSVR